MVAPLSSFPVFFSFRTQWIATNNELSLTLEKEQAETKQLKKTMNDLKLCMQQNSSGLVDLIDPVMGGRRSTRYNSDSNPDPDQAPRDEAFY